MSRQKRREKTARIRLMRKRGWRWVGRTWFRSYHLGTSRSFSKAVCLVIEFD